MNAARFGWTVGCALVVATAAAHAAETEDAKDGQRVIEVSAFLKPYASLLWLPPELVEATAELDRVFDEARALLPPEYQGQDPDDVTLPAQVAITSWTGRVQGRATFFDALELEAAWQASLVLASSQAFGAGAGQAGVLGTPLVEPARRFADFDPYLVDEGTLRLHHNLDRLLLRWQTPDFALTVGRQALSWGTGRLWNPTDLVSPFSPADVDREVRRGADAVRLSLPLAELTQMELVWLPRQALVEQGFVVRVQTNVWQTDVSGSAAKYLEDLVLGADAAGDLGPFGVHGEIAWTLPLVDLTRDDPYLYLSQVRVEGEFVRAVVGADWRPLEQVVLGAEYYWNGFGADGKDAIVAKLTDERVVRGEVFGAARHYVGVVTSWLADELLTIDATALVNVGDPGVLVVPALEYWLEQRVLLRAGGFVPIAQGVDVDVFRALHGADVIGQTEAFRRATHTLGARSEYGLSPAGAFVQLGAYFP
ncbi:MAG: hypothetical protein A2138_03460 [Deltaproteobacteria bacterium RBG_16_71_12]|nr:MAG: hypothetical protein A2138_03460 [Deltaproteobacteria bacterium RBG_16_71_12]